MATPIFAQVRGGDDFQEPKWFPVARSGQRAPGTGPILSQLADYRLAQMNTAQMRQYLSRAPHENDFLASIAPIELSLPMKDGSFRRFAVFEMPILSEELQAQHPELRTFRGQGIDDPSEVAVIDYTTIGFHAMVLSQHGSWFIDPVDFSGTNTYAIHEKSDSLKLHPWRCFSQDPSMPFARRTATVQATGSGNKSGATLKTYRLALNGTVEYTAFFGGVANANAAMVTSINRVSGVYEIDATIRLNMTYNKPFTGSDPFSNGNGGSMLSQNQTECDTTVGNANYDIGHVFSTGGGGVAGLGVVGSTGNKAWGVTGQGSPVGDAFDIDYVAHEMGHQFRGNHSFNGTTSACGGGNRNAATAWEVGSGSTIMGYAGICGGENVQLNSDAYFHSGNQAEIIHFKDSLIPTVGTGTATGNTFPTVSAGADYTIPQSTPFMLTGTANDINGDTITYCWEQMNTGTASPTTNNTTRPLVRSFLPTINPVRVFPRQIDLLSNGGVSTTWEILPNVNRSMTFRCTVRDNRAGGGGVNWDEMVITVNGSAFSVTAPNTAVSIPGNTNTTVTWNVGGGSVAPNVDIWLSTNGGASFFNGTATLLLSNTPNDGSQSVTLPNTPSTQCRIMVKPTNNIFFDISNVNFTITNNSNVAPVLNSIGNKVVNEESLLNFTATASDANAGQVLTYSLQGTVPSGASINPSTGLFSWTPTEAQGFGVYNVIVRVTDNGSPAMFDEETVQITVNEVAKTVSGTVDLLDLAVVPTGRQVEVQIRPVGSTSPVETKMVTLNGAGAYSFDSQAPAGTYDIAIKGSHWLRKLLPSLAIASTGRPNVDAALKNGDVDGNNSINLLDYDAFSASFDKITGDAGFNAEADLDGDGYVGLLDYDIFSGNFDTEGDA